MHFFVLYLGIILVFFSNLMTFAAGLNSLARILVSSAFVRLECSDPGKSMWKKVPLMPWAIDALEIKRHWIWQDMPKTFLASLALCVLGVNMAIDQPQSMAAMVGAVLSSALFLGLVAMHRLVVNGSQVAMAQMIDRQNRWANEQVPSQFRGGTMVVVDAKRGIFMLDGAPEHDQE